MDSMSSGPQSTLVLLGGGVVVQANVDFSIQKRPRRQHHRAAAKANADLRYRADDAIALDLRCRGWRWPSIGRRRRVGHGHG